MRPTILRRLLVFVYECLLSLLVFAQTTHAGVTNVLVEAETFSATGGWQVDAQFVEQMGSPYLIAHGLGKPVADASTTVPFSETGDYRVWVRTRNWVPSHPEAPPGRFKVAVNGVTLAPEFGTELGTWHWQSGGTVSISGTTAQLALKDLTGFDGRCDAIAFIKGSDEPPPASGAALANWRQAVLNESLSPSTVRQFDCVIVGGGMAGCCAAIAAARSGITVAFVHDRPVLGGNASQEVRVATRGQIRNSIVDEIDTLPYANRDSRTVTSDADRLAKIQAEPNITLFMPWRAYAVGTDEAKRITHVDARNIKTANRVRLQAAIFIDCTGDGWIGYWAGADYRMGRESVSEFGESRAPATPDAKTMGNSLMWSTKTAASAVAFPSVPWALDVSGTNADTGGDWDWEYGMSLNTITDAEEIRDFLLRAIYGNFSNAKAKSGNANLDLAWVPFVAGKRESRRLLGDHILTQADLVNGVYFEDAIATTDWGIDLHSETAIAYRSTYSKTTIASSCYFPFRSLYSRNVPNLMMAGRCFSATHVGMGSPRVQNTTGQMGVAVGYAAAICKQYGILPRDIYRIADRTLELQARISGVWPQRAEAVPVIIDNTDACAAATGAWTTGTSPAGFYGSNFLHGGNSAQGTNRVSYTPTLALPGKYDIALRWTDGATHASNTPVWVLPVPTIAASNAIYIRNTQPAFASGTNELLIGRFAASDYTRGLLRFDLSAIPAGATITSAQLKLTISVRDADSQLGGIGTDGMRVHRVTESFTPAETTWSQKTASTAWSTAGGTFDATPLSTIASPTGPDAVNAGNVLTFPQTSAMLGAVTNARTQGTSLDLIVRTPSIETTYALRKLYRIGIASLSVTYAPPAGTPPSRTVDQRTGGGQWTSVGTYDLPSASVQVVIGNDGADGSVVADAVQFTNLNAASGDIDGDGLPDAWERYHFLSETAARPDEDSDHDGRSNFVECMTGTDPNNASSRFDMRLALDSVPGQFVLTWPSVAGKTYRVEVSDDMQTFTPLLQGIAATPPENSCRVTLGKAKQFFRISVE